MRLITVTVTIAALVLVSSLQSAWAQSDDATANMVLGWIQAGNSTTPKLDLTPTVDKSIDCMTREDTPGTCVLYYQCDVQTKTVITDGVGLLDLRTNTCPHYLQVCCKPSLIQKKPIMDREIEEAPYRNKNMDSAPTPEATSTTAKPNIAAKEVPSKRNEIRCGVRNPGAVNPFIFRDKDVEKNSQESLFGDFPWMVAILKKFGNSNVWSQKDYLGGGTLIHPSVVMTVAHKLEPRNKRFQPDQLKCRAGEWDTQTEYELYAHQERDIKKFIMHENYYRVSVYNDIALLILEKPFELKGAPHIGTGCLATTPAPLNRVCYSMGWGLTDLKSKKYATVLKKVLLHPLEKGDCQKKLRDNSRLGHIFEVHESLICANGDVGVDTCRGDGGAPLVCAVSDDPGETRYAVYGMVAYGTKCFDPNVPGMYADTVYLKSWVDEKMRNEGFDSQYYTL